MNDTIYYDNVGNVEIVRHGEYFFVRTPNATISIQVTHDRLGNEMTSIGMVSDDPWSIETPKSQSLDVVEAHTVHPTIATQMQHVGDADAPQ